MIFADFIVIYFLDDVFASPGEFCGMAQVMAILVTLYRYMAISGYTDMAIAL